MINSIQVYGPGCANCQKLYKLAVEAVDEIGADIKIEKVENLNDMMAAGVMRTPGLGFDGRVVLQGKIPNAATLKNWIINHNENK
ncbi:MAG: TM0996/MTH895 family glutaredoxin-like protein [Syntrophaceae bacterium]|nr:TM0996/MTH895 family glutaredoxin-like protein [Syntrophaceae bacterium]